MPRWTRSFLRVFLTISLVLVVVVGLFMAHFLYRLDIIPADTTLGFNSPYYQHVPASVARKATEGQEIHLLVIPSNSGGVHDDLGFHQRFALLQTFLGYLAFSSLDVAIVVPIFPRTASEWTVYTHALDRDVFTTTRKDLQRPDLQLIKMIDNSMSGFLDDGWTVEPRVLLLGFSASGMFVNRFALMHPERVLATSIGSPGGWPIAPVDTWEGHTLAYPVGISDLPDLLSRELDIDSYSRIPQLFWLGDQDANDSVPFRDGYEPDQTELVQFLFGSLPVERWTTAEEIYRSVRANVVFQLYPGLAHRPSLQAVRDTTSLFRSIIAGD